MTNVQASHSTNHLPNHLPGQPNNRLPKHLPNQPNSHQHLEDPDQFSPLLPLLWRTAEKLTPTPASASPSRTSASNCPTCGGPLTKELPILGRLRTVRLLCPCAEAALEARKAEEQYRREVKRLQRLQKYSLMEGRFHDCTLEAWDDDLGSPQLKKVITSYLNHWPRMKADNLGLLIHGGPGIGKSHAAFTLANELMNRHRTPLVAVSAIGLLSRIKETYAKYGQEAEIDVINTLKNAALLIIDDLGAEQKTEWSAAMLYQIIDSRYRSAKPLILTTNLALPQLRKKLTQPDGIDRTYDRILEACLPIQVEGESHRARAARDKRQQFLQLLQNSE